MEAPTPAEIRAAILSRTRIKRRKVASILISLTFVAIYVVSFVSYRSSVQRQFVQPNPPGNGISATFLPVTMDAEQRMVTGSLVIFPGYELIDEYGRLTKRIEIDVWPTISTKESLIFEEGLKPSPRTFSVEAWGQVASYPFDSYKFQIALIAQTGVPGAQKEIPTGISMFFDVPGWTFAPHGPADADPSTSEVTGVLTRTVSVRVIAAVLVTLLIALAGIAVSMVLSMTQKRISLDIALGAWCTGMLFALVPIRVAMPGAPPIGSAAIDVLIFAWVEVAILGSVVMVAVSLLINARDNAMEAKARHADEVARDEVERAALRESEEASQEAGA